jgi:RNA polymerase sigma-70 factor (ECF subfamily)
MNTLPTRQHLEKFVRKHLYKSLESEIDDAVQMTMIQAHTRMHTFRGESKLSTWVFGIALQVCRNINSKFGPRLDVLVSLDEFADLDETVTMRTDSSVEPDCQLEQKELMTEINKWVKTLPVKHKIVIELLMEGLTYQQVADRLNLPIGTVRSRIHRARETWEQPA